jgi:hypothetical protein
MCRGSRLTTSRLDSDLAKERIGTEEGVKGKGKTLMGIA